MTRLQAPASGWQELYARRMISAAEAAATIKSGDHLYVPVGQQVQAVIRALLQRRDELQDVVVTGMPAVEYEWYTPEFVGRITPNVLYANNYTRAALEQRLADFTPFMFYGAHKAVDEGRVTARPIDVNLINVTPPNHSGYVCLGHSVWDAKTTVRRAAMTIAVVNDHLARTFGDSWLHVSEIDWFVEDHVEPVIRPTPPADPWDTPIAGYVGSLVQDRDTMQIGTGSTTGNLIQLGAFDERHDLGYFAELTVPGTVDLVRKGIITGHYMATHPGKFVATTIGNSIEDRDYIDGNPSFELFAVDYVHDPRAIAANDNYKAINNAIAIDLTGQIAASTIGPRIYSGTGGHFSFAMGAFMSRGGRYVCVLPATARGGTVSRITPQFEAGQIVTVPRDIADTVVTEYGIAHLLNRSVRERAEALVAIAHPDFRAELRRAAQALFWP